MILPLDHIREAARLNRFNMPVFAMFHELLETAPITSHWWPDWDMNGVRLPETTIWPDQHFCLSAKSALHAGSINFCITEGDFDTEMAPWFEGNTWYLDAVMVFTRTSQQFDVIPWMRPAHGGVAFFPEMQLQFTHVSDQGWGWQQSNTGFVQPYVYQPLMRDMSEEGKAAVDEAVNHLGNVVELFIGAYYAHLQKPGKWRAVAAKPARVKKDDKGRVKKVYEIATQGYSTYTLD